MNHRGILNLVVGSAFALLAHSGASLAQDWRPDGQVTLIVPSSPGGGHDTNARALAQVMEKHAGQPIIVLNQPAGGGVVAYSEMKNAAPDGLTLGQVAAGSLINDKTRLENVDYDETSFQYVGMIAADPNLLVVSSTGPYADMTLDEFLAVARDKPDTVLMGVSGNWGNQDYVRHAIEAASGAKFRRVPVKGGRAILLAILGGDLSAGLLYPSEVQAQIDAGKLKVLAHNGDAPYVGLPDLKSFREQGYDVGFPAWRALVLPFDTPQEVADGWRAILAETMADPALKAAYQSAAIGYGYVDAEDTRTAIDEAAVSLRAVNAEVGLGN